MPQNISDNHRDFVSRYLLGRLSEADEEKVEDRLATNTSYHALFDEVERQLVRAYAIGEMAPDEVADFERHYLVTGERNLQVTIIRGLLEAHRRGQAAQASSPARKAWLMLAAAVSVVAAVLISHQIWVAPRPGGPPSSHASPGQPNASAREPQKVEATARRSPGLGGQAQSPSPAQPLPHIQDDQNRKRAEVAARKSLSLGDEVSSKPPLGRLAREPELHLPPPPDVPAQAPQVDNSGLDAVVGELPSAPAIVQPGVSGGPKRKVAVLDFNYGTVMTSVQAVFGTNQDIGKGISDMLVSQLLSDGTYRVVERNALDKIQKEQNFSNSDRIDASQAAKIGRILGVDAVIIGDVTTFGREDQNKGLGGGALSHWGAKYGVGDVGSKKAKAVVEITARLIDVNTGEILASAGVRGESSRSGTSLLGGGGANGGAGQGAVEMGSSNFSTTIIGEATSNAVTQLGKNFDTKAALLPASAIQVDGLVADATGNTIVVNVGSKNGLRVGDYLTVSRVIRVIKDPSTGKPLRSMAEAIGQVQVIQVYEDSAVGTFTGTLQPKVGDSVKGTTAKN